MDFMMPAWSTVEPYAKVLANASAATRTTMNIDLIPCTSHYKCESIRLLPLFSVHPETPDETLLIMIPLETQKSKNGVSVEINFNMRRVIDNSMKRIKKPRINSMKILID
jgi:hypothetical protein